MNCFSARIVKFGFNRVVDSLKKNGQYKALSKRNKYLLKPQKRRNQKMLDSIQEDR